MYGFRGNVQSLATHTFGCRVLQRALEYLPEVITAPLIEELHASTLLLMQNQFGVRFSPGALPSYSRWPQNYVIQFVIEHAEPQDSAIVVSKLRGRLLVMARHKFASNVCEKALTFAHPETRRQLIDEILSPRPEGAVVLSMMKDQYASMCRNASYCRSDIHHLHRLCLAKCSPYRRRRPARKSHQSNSSSTCRSSSNLEWL